MSDYLPEQIETAVTEQWDPDDEAARAAKASTHIRGNVGVLIPIVFAAHRHLAAPGTRTDLAQRIHKEPPTFRAWLTLAKIPERTAYSWLQAYDESGRLLVEQPDSGEDEPSPRVKAQVSVRYPKNTLSLDRALLRWYKTALELHSGGALPEAVEEFVEAARDVWPEIYEEAMGSPSKFIDFMGGPTKAVTRPGVEA